MCTLPQDIFNKVLFCMKITGVKQTIATKVPKKVTWMILYFLSTNSIKTDIKAQVSPAINKKITPSNKFFPLKWKPTIDTTPNIARDKLIHLPLVGLIFNKGQLKMIMNAGVAVVTTEPN